MLLFRSEESVVNWCQANNVPQRPLINMTQLWYLAQTWYGNRLTVDSRRPGPDEMAGIFSEIGLKGSFWDPQADDWASRT
jgi:hypothetical protein